MMFDQLLKVAQDHPEQNSFVTMGGEQALLVNRPDDIFLIMRAPSQVLEKDLGWMRQILGPSRFTENGAAWQLRRELSDSFFKAISGTSVEAITKERIAKLIASSDPAAASPCHLQLYQALLDVFMQSQFSVTSDQLSINASHVRLLSETAAMNSNVSNRYIKNLHPNERADHLRAYNEARTQVLDALRSLRRISGSSNGVLSRIVEAESRGDIENADLELLNLIVAGVDSSSAALHWNVLVLAQCPEILAQIRAEGASAAARFVDSVLTYLPATPLVARRTLAEFRLSDGLPLQKGQRLIGNLLGVNGADVETLITRIREQFLSQRKPGRQLAFGAGERVCAGIIFAKLMLRAAVETIATHSRPQIKSGPLGALEWRLSLSLKRLPTVAFT